MKSLVLTVLLLIAPSLHAQLSDRQILLRPDGTIYSIESVSTGHSPLVIKSARVIELTIQRADSVETILVPASLTGGLNSEPSIAFDSSSETLFVFWQRMPSRTTSELVFTSFRAGKWADATVLDPALFRFRTNLRIAATRWVEQKTAGGGVEKVSELVLHAIWWEETGFGELGRYALLSLHDGKVSSTELRDLSSMVTKTESVVAAIGDYLSASTDRQMFRHPAIFEMPENESVEVVFGNFDTNRFHKVGIRVVRGEGVIRIPIGVTRGGFPSPGGLIQIANSRMTTIALPGSGNLAFYSASDRQMQYTLFKGGVWSDVQSVALNDRVSLDGAVGALQKLVASAER